MGFLGVGWAFSFGGDFLSFGGSGGVGSLAALTVFVSALIMDGDCICSGCTLGNVFDAAAVAVPAGLLFLLPLEAPLLLFLLTAGIVLKCCSCWEAGVFALEVAILVGVLGRVFFGTGGGSVDV